MAMMRALIRLILGPVLLWQGAQIRRDILRLPEPSGARDGRIGDGPPLSVLLLGDSSAAGVGTATQADALSGQLMGELSATHQVDWSMIAKTGWTTEDAWTALKAQTPQQIDLAVLSLGVNDVTTETGIATWLDTYQRLIETLRRDWHARLIVVSGLPPMGAFPALRQPLRWYLGLQATAYQTALFRRFGNDDSTVCLPLVFDLDTSAMAEDGFHPGPLVYQTWAKEIAGVIRQHLPQMPPHRSDPAAGGAHRSTGT